VWDESEIAALGAYNDLLEARLSGAIVAQKHGKIVDQLQFALDGRVAIERAIGLLMGREGIDGTAAFNQLRQAARSSRRRVREIAEEILEGHSQGDDSIAS
jgi:AmiR/NasT family two-component response regulator